MNDISLMILCYKSLPLLHIWMPNELQYHSKSCSVCFYFHSKCVLDVHPPPRSPFTRRLGLVLKATNWLRLLAPLFYNLFSLSITLSAYTISRFVFHHTEHLLLCPPFKRIKVISEPFSSEKTRDSLPTRYEAIFLSLTLWTSHELGWPSPSPKNSCMCWIFYTTFTCQTLRDCSFCFPVYLDNSAGLNACLGVNWRKHASTLQPFSRHCKIFFRGLVLLRFFLTSVSFHLRKKNGLTA